MAVISLDLLSASISYQVVTELHQGTLECLSPPGRGTIFRMELPLC
ncbi:MAG: hypothetical protein VKL39_10905 [Leptolyngbyaceae bacterium]|nr:hypothetical protein [Leptolyngbyaceae bacterium]